MLCKGGIENTIRDLVLHELDSGVRNKSNGQLFVTGERKLTKGSGRRVDLAAYASTEVDRSWMEAYQESVELKFNFDTQRSEYGRLAEALRAQAHALGNHANVFGGMVCVATVENASLHFAQILDRYVARTTYPRNIAAGEHAKRLELKLNEKNVGLTLRHITTVPLNTRRLPKNTGRLDFFVTW